MIIKKITIALIVGIILVGVIGVTLFSSLSNKTATQSHVENTPEPTLNPSPTLYPSPTQTAVINDEIIINTQAKPNVTPHVDVIINTQNPEVTHDLFSFPPQPKMEECISIRIPTTTVISKEKLIELCKPKNVNVIYLFVYDDLSQFDLILYKGINLTEGEILLRLKVKGIIMENDVLINYNIYTNHIKPILDNL